MPLFSRFVEIGRVAMVNFGKDVGKLAVIIDVVDQNRAFVDGPATGVPRQVIPMKRLTLTPLTVRIGRGARTGTVAKVWAAEKVEEKWAQTSWAKKLALRAKRASLTDFDRFKVMLLKKKRSALLNKAVKATKSKK